MLMQSLFLHSVDGLKLITLNVDASIKASRIAVLGDQGVTYILQSPRPLDLPTREQFLSSVFS